MGNAHDHRSGDISTARLLGTMVLNFLITGAEVAGGLLSGILSLLSDALHNLTDGISHIVSDGALRLARRDRTARFAFGLKSARVLAAALNASALIAIGLYLVKKAYGRFLTPEPVCTGPMIAVASVGLAANVTGTLMLREGAKNKVNVRSSCLHPLSDVFSSVAVILGGIAMHIWGAHWLDPLLMVAIGLYVLRESFDILREAVSVPPLYAAAGVVLSQRRHSLGELPGERDLHPVHRWCMDERHPHFETTWRWTTCR